MRLGKLLIILGIRFGVFVIVDLIVVGKVLMVFGMMVDVLLLRVLLIKVGS